MLFAAATMVVGLGFVAALSQTNGYRLGGVLVLPLLVIYTLREPTAPLVFVAATAVAWGALWALREYTLTHGRRTFLVAVTVGALASIGAATVVSLAVPEMTDFYETEVVGSVFPGIAAYNLTRVDEERRLGDVTALVGGYLGLLLVGLLALQQFRAFWATTPPFVLLPTSDIPRWLGVEPVSTTFRHVVPQWLAVGLLLLDVTVYEFVRSRYDLRLSGIVLVPLVAIFAVNHGSTPLVYAAGATVVFLLVSLVHWLTLLYGRNLLALALVCGTLYGVLFAVVQPVSVPGTTLFFIGLFTGIGAYNLHRTSSRNRGANIRLSAALFVVFYALLLVFVPGTPETVLSASRWIRWGVAATVLGLAALAVYRLERSIPDAGAFERASVFSNVPGRTPLDRRKEDENA